MTGKTSGPPASPDLAPDIRRLIDESRVQGAATVNTALTMLYWRIGKRIHEEVLKGERVDYGAAIVATVSQQSFPGIGKRGMTCAKKLKRSIIILLKA